MSRHYQRREDSGFDQAQLEEAARESVQDAYVPPPAPSGYDDEQAQIRRAEQESVQDAYAPGYDRPQGNPGYGRGEHYGRPQEAGYGRGGYQQSAQEYAGRGGAYNAAPQGFAGYGRGEYERPAQGYGGEGRYGRPGDGRCARSTRYSHRSATDSFRRYEARPPRVNQPEYAPPSGPPPQDDQFGDSSYSAPPQPPPVDDYGRPVQPHEQGEGHHHHHHHQEEEGRYEGANPYGNEGYHPGQAPEGYGGPRPSAGGGYSAAAERPQNFAPGAGAPTSQHHGSAGEYYNNEPPQPRPHQEVFYDAQEGDENDNAPPPPPKPHSG
ncbi:hypothetical protein CALVIDRAFT_28606 [Calocera viscosa TUFC12733]|uniref:Uncharacterized protein n=1 Tax=Calocera viscosa (strain TUFC12733) TaxID=1330018 RepID=A0A167PAD9_CALVF|nr:hypothetical protein CALVIDRAFT_28606 [Calocera viscosa TUFC12733]